MPPSKATLASALSGELHVFKLNRRIKQFKSQKLSNLPAAILEAADRDRIDRLREKVADIYKRDATSAAKYADPRKWLLLNTLRIGELGLHNTSGLRVLDIGCGPSYFLSGLRLLGHQAEGVDAPASYLSDVERLVYSELIEALHCTPYVKPLLIEPFVPLPFPERQYDLITAFWICFNRHRQPDEWGVEEWRFFIQDALLRLRPGGRLFLDLNENPERFGELRYFDQPTLDYFRSVGAVEKGRVSIPKS